METKSKHTEGEWNFKQFKSPVVKFSIVVQSSNGDTICKMMHSDNPSDQIQEANAKLISASPELLAALKTAITIFGKGYEPKEGAEPTAGSLAYLECINAIKKATE